MSTRPEDAPAEVTKVQETADRLADAETDVADRIRVLAGLIRQLAEQVERLVDVGMTTPTGSDPSNPG